MELFHRRKTCILMHKDIPVVQGKYDFDHHGFETIEILNAAHLPVGTVRNGRFSRRRLNDWIVWRGIPGYRAGLLQLLERLRVHDPLDLLERSHMLSVSDCYWLKEKNDSSSWEEVNFFAHDFDDTGFGMAVFAGIASDAEPSACHTPNNTTAGYQRKAWLIRENGLFLAKGGTGIQQEPVNEWLAYRIARQLGIEAVPYDLGIYENNAVCFCPDMADENTDLVPAEDVMRGVEVPEGKFALPYYIMELQRHGIRNAERKINDLLVIDYLMLNTDRHDQNLGILVDADTMAWKGCAPVYDTGTSLGCLLEDDAAVYAEQGKNCRLFNAGNFSHEKLLDLIDLHFYDFTGLEDLAREFGKQLVKYQRFTNISDERIETAYRLFYKRVLRIKKAALRAGR